MKKIIAVFKTHVDVGFTKLSEEIIKSFSEKMPYEVSKICERVKDFKWTMPAWPVYRAVHAENEGARLARSLIEGGQLVWHALPFTTHTEFCGTEELIRGMYFSKLLAEEFGKPMPIAAKMTDVPGHTRGLVSILAKAGVKFLHLGCNPACMPADVPGLFHWEAQDGSRVLTFYNKGSYGSTLLPPPEWPYPVWLAMQQTNDNIGPQKEEDIAKMRRIAAQQGYQLVLGTMDDFYRELEPWIGDEIPVITGDLADTWIHGAGSYPAEVGMLRELRFLLTREEALAELEQEPQFKRYAQERQGQWPNSTQLNSNQPKSAQWEVDGQKVFDRIYENHLLFGEHTWGLDVKTYLGNTRRYDLEDFRKDKELPAYQLIEESWNEQRRRLDSPLKDIAAKGSFEQSFRPDSPETLENSCLAVSLGGDGLRIMDKRTGKSVSGSGFGIFQYDLFSNQEITEFLRSYTYRFFDWSVNDLGRMGYPEMTHKIKRFDAMEVTGNRLSMEDGSGLCCKGVQTTVNLHEKEPYVDITLQLQQKIENPLVESGHILLPFELNDNYRVQFGKPGGTVAIDREIVPNANHGLYCCEKWVRMEDDEKGVLIIPVSNPNFSLGENMIYRFQGKYQRKKPVLWLNVFNNAWGTNFPQWVGGDLKFKLRVVPYIGSMTNARAAEIANETFSDFGIRNITESTADIELLAFKRSMNGKGSVLRIKSTSEQPQTISLRPLFTHAKCSYATLLEEPLYDFSGEISFASAPYEIHTLYFERIVP